MGLFESLKSAVKKTSDLLNTDIRDLFSGKEGRLIDDEFLEDLFALLLRTDMGPKPAQAIVDEVRTEYRNRRVMMEEVLQTVKAKLSELMEQSEHPVEFVEEGPTVILIAGVNGSGKTTSIAKLANRFTQQGKKVVLGAGDTFRAAAVEQLSIWAERLGCEIVKGDPKTDPASVAHRAVARAKEVGADVCLVDTAGRLHTQANLMQELTKIHRVMKKVIPDAPHETLLILDATTGQNGLAQALKFSEAIQCTGLILTKLDGTAKGGVAVAIRQQFELPVKYLGVGEGADDLELFNSQRFVDALFAER